MEVDLDKQGRINLPDYLIDFAALKNQAIVAGMYDRLEIWDEKNWQSYKNRSEKDSIKLAEALGELGI